MSVSSLNLAEVPSYVRPPVQTGPDDGQGLSRGAASPFADYEAPAVTSPIAPVEIGQGAQPFTGCGTRDIALPSVKQVHDIMDLHDNVKLVKRAQNELNAFITRMREDDSPLRSELARMRKNDPEWKSGSGYDNAERAMRTLFVAEAKKSGLYDELKQAAIQRLKDSGNYEDLINQILDAKGPEYGRARAENLIERQFDYGSIDADFRAGEPYFELNAIYEGGWAYGGNEGTVGVYGDKTNVRASGPFDVEFTKCDDQFFYTVKNRLTGEKSAPRLYDPRGTIVEAQGLRAEMFGTPASGDVFSFDEPPKYQIAYPDSNNPVISQENQKLIHQSAVFDRVFGPIIGGPGMDRPSQSILNFLRRPAAE